MKEHFLQPVKIRSIWTSLQDPDGDGVPCSNHECLELIHDGDMFLMLTYHRGALLEDEKMFCKTCGEKYENR